MTKKKTVKKKNVTKLQKSYPEIIEKTNKLMTKKGYKITKKGTKPEKFTPAQIIEALKSSEGFMSSAAKRLGCTYWTIWRYVNKYDEIKNEFDAIKEAHLDFTEAQLLKKIKAGDIAAIIFRLKTLGKSRGFVERQEISGPHGAAFVPIIFVPKKVEK